MTVHGLNIRNRGHVRSRAGDEAGFTLIEMVVVMLIFAITMGVMATGLAPRDRTATPYDIAKQIQSVAFRARADAIAQNRRTAVVLNTEKSNVTYRGKAEVRLPEIQSMSVLAGRELVLTDGRVVLAFLPDGSSSGAEIKLTDSRDRSAMVKVNWLTGLSHIRAGGAE